MSFDSHAAVESFIEAFRACRTRRGRKSRGLFSLEGTRILERALRAEWPLSSVLVSKRFAEAPRSAALLEALTAAGVPLLRAEETVVLPLLEGRSYGEVLALANAREGSLKSAELWKTPAPLLLAAVDIEDPGNTGALLRTAHAIGAAAFLSIGVTQMHHPKAVRTSMGSLFRLPGYEFETLKDAAEALPSGVCTVAASSRPEAGELPGALKDLPRTGPLCLVVGNEAHGLDDEAHQWAQQALRIPMPPGTVDSFSVNAAAAILLYALSTRDAD